jgi:hypothetical protein
MKKQIELTLPPEVAFDETIFEDHVRKLFHTHHDKIIVRPIRRSIDARSRQIKVLVTAEVYIGELPPPLLEYNQNNLPDVTHSPQAIVVGAGPGGMFAALRLIELGIKPILIERGKDVRTRRRDLAALTDHIVNPESNYCFGEGGAGTYSDGKLYTRSKKRGDVRRILEILVAHEATPDILVEAHPHIGTNKLPKIVTNLRETILRQGGEVLFETKVTDFILKNDEIRGVVTANGDKIEGIGVILATGHSARDIFKLCYSRNVYLEAKPFAMGVRIEHQQSFIDLLQYKTSPRGFFLPAASYSWVEQVEFGGISRGVFSFCMCPGGYIVPAATAPGEVVVNGMSPSRRDSHYANSGIVISIEEESWKPYLKKFGVMAGLEMQKDLERRACLLAGGTQTAPAQLMHDFVENKLSGSLLPTSYKPGLASIQMSEVLGESMTYRLREAFRKINQKMKGYLTNNAQIVGVESRTSSPVRIPRNKDNFEHVQIKRLFPCGEGPGYAGGIVSAAMDGERCAENLVALYGLSQ